MMLQHKDNYKDKHEEPLEIKEESLSNDAWDSSSAIGGPSSTCTSAFRQHRVSESLT